MSEPHPFPPYQNLVQVTHELSLLNSTGSVLSWDQETYMPPKAADFRAEQLAYFGAAAHRLFTAPEVGDSLKACEEKAFAAETVEAVNVRNWRWEYDRSTKLSTALVESFERDRSHAHHAWIEARQKSDYSIFAPHLAQLVEHRRAMADLWGYEESPYDALLTGFERGAKTRGIQKLFSELGPVVSQLTAEAEERSKSVPAGLLLGHYPVEAQKAFNRELAEALGFDFEAGRIDTTTHPFCSGMGPSDCRLTTRYDETDFTGSLYGVMHEAGHGLYDQGLLKEYYGTPMGDAVSLGIHESQSRLWENKVGRSRSFWEYWHPRAAKYFPGLGKITLENLLRAVNRVERSFIRVEADEVSYDLHIMLRFQIEVLLMEGNLEVKDVPAVWNDMFFQLFGLKVPDDARGCLQDIHWSMGGMGYFATYTLGNLNSAQLFRKATQDLPGLQKELAAGNYASLLKWLREKVHRHGQRYDSPQLMKEATGETTQAGYHLEYLRGKFL